MCTSCSVLLRQKSISTANFNEFCASVSTCFRTRLAWSDLQLIRDIIFVMETQGWQKILDDESEVGIVKKVRHVSYWNLTFIYMHVFPSFV